jgi:DNA modification methylase
LSAGIPVDLRPLAVLVDSLSPFGRNPRRGDLKLIADSLSRHGQYRPIVVNRGSLTGRPNEILAGNHTWAAARSLGWPEIAATYVDVDDDTASRIVAMDNRANDKAGYDDAALAELLASLPDLAGTGFTDAELNELLASLHTEPTINGDPDDVPEAPAEPVSVVGEVWHLGPHRLLVGDCTDAKAVRDLCDRRSVDLVLTDPPYGVSYVDGDGKKIANDDLRDGALEALLSDAFAIAADLLRPGGPFYIFGPSHEQQWAFRAAARRVGWRIRSELVWVKQSLVLGRSDYQPRHESVMAGYADLDEVLEHDVVLYGWRNGAPHPWLGGRKQTTVWEFPKPQRSAEHPTMKPVAMLEQAIRNSTVLGDIVLDLFAGSGSTLIACHLTGRVGRVVELDPRYADVILTRWQDATGEKPVRASSGEPVDFSR